MEGETLQVRLGITGMDRFLAEIGRIGPAVSESLLAPAIAGGALFGFGALTEHFQEFNLQVEKGMKSTGLSAEAMGGLAYASEKTDVSIESLQHALKTFSEYLVHAGQGSRNLKEALLEQGAIFQALPDGAQKATMATERFGKAGSEMLQFLSKGPDKLNELFDRGQKLSGVNDQTVESARAFADSLTDFKFASEGLAGSLENSFLPTLTRMQNKLTELIVKFREWRTASAIPSVAVEAAGIGGGLMAAIAGMKAGMDMLNKSLGVGAISSLKDLGAVISLLTQRALSLIGPLGLIVAGITAAGVIIMEFYRMISARNEEVDSTARLAKQVESLDAANHKRLESLQEEKKITEEQATRLKAVLDDPIFKSSSIEHQSDVQTYMASRLDEFNAPAPKPQKQWTKEELEVENNALNVQREMLDVMRQKDEMANKGRLQGAMSLSMLKETEREENIILQKRTNAAAALEQKAITQVDYDDIDLAVRKELLAIDTKKQAIAADDVRVHKQALDLDLESLNRKRELLQNNFTASEADKRSGSIALLQQASQRIQKEIDALNDATKKMSLTDPRRFTNEAAGKDLTQQKAGADFQAQQAQQTPDPNSFAQQMTSTIGKITTEWGTAAQKIAQTFSSTINTGISSVSSNLTGVIMRTQSWAMALRNIGTTIVSQIIESFIKMSIEWLLQHTIMAAISKAFAAQDVVTHTTAEGAKTAATAAGGVARNLITFGEYLFHQLCTGLKVVAHLAGEVLMTAGTLVQTIARKALVFLELQPQIVLAATEAAASVAGIPYVGPILAPIAFAGTMAFLEASAVFSQGGFTGYGALNEPAGIVHRGEFVMPAETVKRIGIGNLEMMRHGSEAFGGGGKGQTGGGRSSFGGDTHVHFWGMEDAMNQHIRNNPETRGEIVKLVGQNMHKFIPRQK